MRYQTNRALRTPYLSSGSSMDTVCQLLSSYAGDAKAALSLEEKSHEGPSIAVVPTYRASKWCGSVSGTGGAVCAADPAAHRTIATKRKCRRLFRSIRDPC